MTAYEKLTKCYECVKSKINFEPKVALVLGSGLGDYANSIDVKYTLSYKDIEGFPTSTVEGHKGQFGRKNATDTQKETGNGNERNRNEHCLSERLEFFFHQFPPQ